MLRLYWLKGACSLAPHLVLEELSLPFEAIRVTNHDEPPEEFSKLSPLGTVPLLILENGEPLSEAAVILQYLADLKPEKKLIPRPGTLERVRMKELLNFIATELHKGFGPLFTHDFLSSESAREEYKAMAREHLAHRFDMVAQRLRADDYIFHNTYSIADAYLYTILNWSSFVKLDMHRWPTLVAYINRVKARPATQTALRTERLII